MAIDEKLLNEQLDTISDPFGEASLRDSVEGAMEANPERAAQALPFANRNGLPLDMAERNLEYLQRKSAQDAIDYGRIMRRTPTLGEWLQVRENARIAHDDIPALEGLSDFVRSFGGGAVESIGMTSSGFGNRLENLSQAAMNKMVENDNADWIDATILGTVGFMGDILQTSGEAYKTVAREGILGSPSILPPEERRGQMMNAIGQALGQVGVQAGAAIYGGGVSTGVTLAVGQTMDQADELAKKKGIYGTMSGELAAYLYGGIASQAERLGLNYLLQGIPPSIKVAVVNRIASAVTKIGLSPGGTAANIAYKGLDTAFRGLVEGSQEMTEGFLQNVVNVGIMGDDRPLFEALTGGLKEQGEVGGGVGLIVGGIVNLMTKGKVHFDVQHEKNTAQAFKDARAKIASTKTAGRSPEKLNELLRGETGNRDVYLNPKPVQTFYQNMSDEEKAFIRSAMPDFESKLEKAVQSNTDLTLNRADYHTYIQTRPGSEELDEWVRLVPEHLSVRDRAEYDAMMEEIFDIANVDPSGMTEGERVQQNVYNQLIQRMGQKGLPSGNVDVARLLADNPRAFYETVLARAGGREDVQDVLDRLIRDVRINRVLPSIQGLTRKDDFDLTIDKARNRQRDKAARAAREAKKPRQRDIFGTTKQKKGKSAPTPVISYLADIGGIDPNSRIASEVKHLGVTPKTHPRLFRVGGMKNFDRIPLSEMRGALADFGLDPVPAPTDSRDNTPYYIDNDWILDQIRDESFGLGKGTFEQTEKESAMSNLDDIADTVRQAGLDIETATNAQVKDALERMEREWMGYEAPTAEDIAAESVPVEVQKQAEKIEKEEEKAPEFKPEEKPAPLEKIEDFGEKIEGAKKDLWKDYNKSITDELPSDLSEITIAKHFPAPDYEAMIAKGMDIKVLAAIKAMREHLPAKPRLSYKVKHWADQLKTFREFTSDLINGTTKLDEVTKLMRNTRTLRDLADRMELYGELGYPAFKNADKAGIRMGNFSTLNGVNFPPGGKNLWVIEKDGRYQYKAGGFETRAEAVDVLRSMLNLEPEKSERSVKLDIYQVTRTGEIIIGKKMGAGKFLDLKGGFTSGKEARQYLQENEAALLLLLEKKKEIRPERKSVNDPRKGEDYRLGEDVSPEKFAAEFGFRGVQFGNYVEQSRRVDDLNNAYDALMDLSRLIGVPSRAVSLNGTLGLAFGARGKGGKTPAAAHFEPDNIVINLTKMDGFGALGHEWWHAMDNFFGKQRGEAYLTERPVKKQKREGDKMVEDTSVRQEVVDAFKGVMDAIKKTNLHKRSSELDQRRTGKPYWSTDIELSARAFEAYLVWKSGQKGESNDYLANIVPPEAHELMNKKTGTEEPYPYPTKEELSETIGPAFDKLFETMKTKVTPQGITLYQRENKISELQKKWESGEEYGFADTSISENDKEITLGKVEIKKGNRSKGGGTKVMRELSEYADRVGKRIVLSPSTDFGGSSVERLKDFYKNFGFVENKGKNKDFTTKETMIRNPQKGLKQGGGDTIRGSISFMPDGKAVINIFEKEDLSTVMHEFGHLYWKAMTEIAALENAPEQIIKDVRVMREWVGAKEGETLTVAQEEKIADGFLSYLRTGDAPSLEMKSAFQRFKGWLSRLYKGARDSLPKITPEVKDVFDRMLATDEQIEELRGKPEFAPDPVVMNILTKVEQDRYRRKVEKTILDAKERLFKKAMRQSEVKATNEYKDARTALTKEITEAVSSERGYRAVDEIIKAGGLDQKKVVEMKGREILKYLNAHGSVLAKKGGIDPATIAGIMGYSGSDEMLMEIMNLQKKKDKISQMVDEEMIRRHGDMLNDGTIEREAMDAFHTELRAEMLELEMETLAAKANIPAPSRAAIKAKAIDMMGTSKVREIIPYRFYRAEVKSARESGVASAKGDFPKAAVAKAQQLLNHHLYRMSLDARDDIDAHIAKWRRILNRDDDRAGKNIDIDYVYAARAILAKHGIGRDDWPFQQWFTMLQNENPEAAEALGAAVAMYTEDAVHYKEMNYEDFQALADAVDNLINVGKDQRSITVDGKKVELAEAIKPAMDALEDKKDSGIATGFGGALSKTDKAKKALYGLKAMGRRVESWVRVMDGGKYSGVFRKLIWDRVSDAVGVYRDERAIYLKKMVDALSPHAERLHGEPIVAPELVSEKTGETYKFEDKGELVGMLLHLGNGFEPGSNGYKLLKGYGWDFDSFQAFLDRASAQGIITKQDWDLVQDLWNLAEELKPAVWKAHKDMYGFRPKEIVSVPLNTSFGQYKGGYWPAIVDRTKSKDAEQRAARETILKETNPIAFPTAGRGATKTRVDAYAGPLEMSMRLLPSHIDWALRFVHIEPAVKDVGKVMINREFRQAMERVDPSIIDEMIVPWLNRVARQSHETPKPGQGWKALNSTASWMRKQAGLTTMAGNVINTMQQFTGLAPMMYKTGARNFARAWLQYMQNPQEMAANIRDSSAVMRHNMTIMEQDYLTQVNDIIKDRGPHEKVKDFAERNGYFLQRVAQGVVNNIGWTAAFNQAMNGDANGVKAGDEAAAIKYADSVVSETQGFMNPENVSNIEAGTPLARLFTIFYSFFNSQANFLSTEVQSVTGERGTVRAKSAKLFYMYLVCYVIPSFIADFIGAAMRGALPDDDDEDGTILDDWFQFFMISQARYASAMVPFAGQAVNYAIAKFTPGTYDDQISLSPAIGMIERTIDAPFSLWRAMFADGDKSKAVNDTLTGLGLVNPLVAWIRRPVAYMADVSDGTSDAEDIGDITRGILAGPAVRKQ